MLNFLLEKEAVSTWISIAVWNLDAFCLPSLLSRLFMNVEFSFGKGSSQHLDLHSSLEFGCKLNTFMIKN